jgi:phosphate transport system permease protein
MGSDVSERSADRHPDNETREAAPPAAHGTVPSAIDEIGEVARSSAPITLAGTPPAPVTVEGEEGAVALEPPGVRPARREPHPPTPTYNLGDRIFNWLTAGFAGLILVIIATMVATLAIQSRVAIRAFGLQFFYTSTWDPIHNVFGAAPAILGTVYTSLLALLFAAPVGVMVAIFLVEMAPRKVRTWLGFIVELLAAVPSIVYGLWALVILVPIVRNDIQPPLIGHFGNIFLFQGYPIGLGVFTAALILSIMILPTIASITRDVMLAVPNAQRDAMLALGATKWETTWKAVIPYARSGIIGGIVLALGRAIGETMAVQMVIGNTQTFNLSIFNFGTTLPATIVNQFTEATGDTYRSALIELAFILMVVAIILNAIARLLVWRVTRVAG